MLCVEITPPHSCRLWQIDHGLLDSHALGLRRAQRQKCRTEVTDTHGSRRANRTKLAMLRLAPHLTRVLAWLLATACTAHAGETTASGTADQFKLMIGSMLMTDYIYRGNTA